MPTSGITVSGLVATPGIGNISLQWAFSDPHANGLTYMALDKVEVHAATSNDRALASNVAEGLTNAKHMSLIEGAIWYYWIRARDRNVLNGPLYGDWYPSGANSGVPAQVGSSATFALNRLMWR